MALNTMALNTMALNTMALNTMALNNFIPPDTDLQAADPELLHFVNLDKNELIQRWKTKSG